MNLSRFAVVSFASLAVCCLASAAPDKTFDGLVLPLREVVIGSPVEAPIEAIKVREGDKVEKGELLVVLHSKMEQLEAKRAAAAVEKREFEFKSSENLFKDKIISEDEALQSRVELDLAKLTLEMAEEQVNRRQLKAPFSGIVVERFLEVGEMVRPSEPVLVLLDLKQVYVQFYVRAENLSEIRVDQSASIVFPSLSINEPVVGQVDFIDPRVDAASGLLRVRVLLENEEGTIKAGVRARLTLLAE
jgi:RND family efflux transporter MFP subunit